MISFLNSYQPIPKKINRPCVAYLLKCLQNGGGHRFKSQRWYTKSPETGRFKFSISLTVLFLSITMQSEKLDPGAYIFKQ